MDKSKIYVDAEGLYEVSFSLVDNKLVPYVVIPPDKINDSAFCTCAQNLTKMLKVQTAGGGEFDFSKHSGENLVISIGKMKLGTIDNFQEMGEYQSAMHVYDAKFHLTTFELKMLSQGSAKDIEALGIPFDRGDENDNASVKTDLHTHFTGVLYGDTLMKIGLQNDVKYPAYLLQNLGVDISALQQKGMQEYELDGCKPCFSLKDILEYDPSTGEVGNQKLYQDIMKSLSIPVNQQDTFKDMDDIYDFRWPFFSFKQNNPETEQLFKDVLFNIGKQYAESGVSYTELAITSLNPRSPHVFEWLNKYIPQIEAEMGVQIRFLAGMVRSADQLRMGSNAENVLNVAKSPYVVGCDFLGHEINSTAYFEQTLRDMARYAMLQDPSFVIRVHSGESAVFLDNTAKVFEIIEDEMAKLQAEGRDVTFPTLRIGHSLNGVTDELIQKCIEHGAIIEKNYSSNLSLNNITSLDSAIIKKLIDAGVKVVLGSDGPGIYHTDARQETTIARGAGLTSEDIMKIIQTEDEYIDQRQGLFRDKEAAYNKRLNRYMKMTDPTSAISMTLSSNVNINGIDMTVYKDLFAAQQKVEDQMKKLQDECQLRNIAFNSQQFEGQNADKKPIFIFGHENDSDLWSLSDQQREDLSQKLREVIHGADPQSYFVINAQNQGLSKLFMQILQEEGGKQPVLGLTVPGRAENSNLLPVDALSVEQRHKSEFDFAQICANRCSQHNGEMFFFGGGGYVSDMITLAHNGGLNIRLDAQSGGASADKAKQYFLNDEKEQPTQEGATETATNEEDKDKPKEDGLDKKENNSNEMEMGE